MYRTSKFPMMTFLSVRVGVGLGDFECETFLLFVDFDV